MFGSPGALTMYSTATRTGLPPPNDSPATVGPASYYVKLPQCRECISETVAPFNNTEMRKVLVPNGYPSPLDYYPYKRPRYEIGTPILGKSDRFKNTRFITNSPGPCYKIRDPWVALVEECVEMHAKRPRLRSQKYISNNIPTVFHPLELRAFITGIDGRVYPLRNKDYEPHIPGPMYNTRGIYTSRSYIPRQVDFSHAGERPSLFNMKKGAGPADYNIPRCLNSKGGAFLGKTDDPTWSTYRFFDFIVCKTSKTIYPSPFNHYVTRLFDRPSPKAVMAPFKSRTKRMNLASKAFGPGPADYFQVICSINDLDPPVYPRYPSYFTMPPEPVPFSCSAERFVDMQLFEEAYSRPSPSSYTIPSFTDMLWCRCKTSKPAICNPKLGFLTSAKARPDDLFKTFDEGDGDMYDDLPPRPWRNTRPRKIRTYPYHGPPPRYPDSPGPIYDTNPGCKAIKGRRECWDPRNITDVGFDCSGCTRKIKIASIDKDIPGPGIYYTKKPGKQTGEGNVKTTGPRTRKLTSLGPGPRHKLHEKYGSGTWRATHLGTFNIYLKGVDVQRPCAGGFRPRGPLDKLADISSGIDRTDPYALQLCNVVIKRLI